MDSLNVQFNLPNELWLKIFTYLTIKNLQKVKLVCKNWYGLTHTRNLLNKSILVLDTSNWYILREYFNNDQTFSKILNYRNVHMDSIVLNNSDLKILQRMRSNVNTLVIRKCQLLFNWNENVFPNLESLDIDDESLRYEQSVSLASSNLRQLRMKFCDNYSIYNALKLLENVSGTINELEISGPGRDISPNCFANTFQLISNLQVLKINHITYYDLKTILHSLSSTRNHLKSIRLLSFSPIKDNSIKIIATKWLHTIKAISLIGCPEITDNIFKYLNLIKGDLIHLDISCCVGLTGKALVRSVATGTNAVLQTLNLNLMHITEDDICLLCERLPNLRTLCLENCRKGITNRSLSYISDYLVNLQILNLNNSLNSVRNNVNANAIASISNLHCPTLRVLHVRHCEKMTAIDIEELVYKCPAIEDLDISSCTTINDDCIFTITTELKELRLLDISWCPNLTQLSIHYLIHFCEKLEILTFYGRDTTWDLVGLKSKLQKLKPDICV